LAAVTFGIAALLAAIASPASAQAPAPQFGSPPFGAIPILFNDQHISLNQSPRSQNKDVSPAALVRRQTI
jgi:hypothetical protein